MKLHGNAALSWRVAGGWPACRRRGMDVEAAATRPESACAAPQVGRRYRREGERGLRDRSSAPRRVANRTPQERVEAIMALRRLRFTAAEIAEVLEMALSTVSAVLLGRHRPARPLGLEQPVRYERTRPGELVHIDVKKLGRIEGGAGRRVPGGRQHYNRTHTTATAPAQQVGYEYVHVGVDDFSRLAYAEVLADEKAATAVGFLCRAVAFFRRHGDPRRARPHRQRLLPNARRPRARLSPPRHPPPRTRPYRPQTNGKAERFIRTLLAGWAYGAIYALEPRAHAALDGWLWHYNHRRRHSALGRQPPVTRTNVLRTYS